MHVGNQYGEAALPRCQKSPTLKLWATDPSETPISMYETTWRQNPENRKLKEVEKYYLLGYNAVQSVAVCHVLSRWFIDRLIL
jgi:hypothetical protein